MYAARIYKGQYNFCGTINQSFPKKIALLATPFRSYKSGAEAKKLES
jgi:hypothetical protein